MRANGVVALAFKMGLLDPRTDLTVVEFAASVTSLAVRVVGVGILNNGPLGSARGNLSQKY